MLKLTGKEISERFHKPGIPYVIKIASGMELANYPIDETQVFEHWLRRGETYDGLFTLRMNEVYTVVDWIDDSIIAKLENFLNENR